MKSNQKNVTLVLVPILLALGGCGMGDEGEQQRDVYTKFEDCVADWGKPELCQSIQEAEAKQFAQESGVQHSSGGINPLLFWGPSFFPGNRAVDFNGTTYAAAGNRAMSKPYYVRSTASPAARASPGTPVRSASAGGGGGTSRGGLGASSAAASSGG